MKVVFVLLYHVVHACIYILQSIYLKACYLRNCVQWLWTRGRDELEEQLSRWHGVRLPSHVAIVIVEDTISYQDVANIVLWSVPIGVRYITLYDVEGKIQKNHTLLEKCLQKERRFTKDCQIKFHNSSMKNSIKNGFHNLSSVVHINLVGPGDGRQDVVRAVRRICARVEARELESRDVDLKLLSSEMENEPHQPEPELLVRFGHLNSVLGFMPWQIRVTEMLSLPTHHAVRMQDYLGLMETYSHCEQRLGK